MANTPTELRSFFGSELVAAGWEAEAKASSTAYRHGRCLVVIGERDGAQVFWNVMPTAPQLPPGVVTRSQPMPVGVFVIRRDAERWSVKTQAFDRSGKLADRDAFSGTEREVLDQLMGESLRRVDHFVRNVESAT